MTISHVSGEALAKEASARGGDSAKRYGPATSACRGGIYAAPVDTRRDISRPYGRARAGAGPGA
jgi:hypothetical protein